MLRASIRFSTDPGDRRDAAGNCGDGGPDEGRRREATKQTRQHGRDGDHRKGHRRDAAGNCGDGDAGRRRRREATDGAQLEATEATTTEPKSTPEPPILQNKARTP